MTLPLWLAVVVLMLAGIGAAAVVLVAVAVGSWALEELARRGRWR